MPSVDIDKEMKKYTKQRYKEFMKNIDDRPYWQWVTIEDVSTCSKCMNLNKKTFLYNDPIWGKMLKRLHPGCRCRFRALSVKNLKERGLRVSNGVDYL